MTENIVEIKGLYKSFGTRRAVRGLSLSVRKGEFFAFLGENGAGKSTTISMICGLLHPDKGEVLVCGHNAELALSENSRSVGIVFQNSVLDPQLSVYDCLKHRAALYGITGKNFEKRLAELTRLLDFKKLQKQTIGKLSGGQKRKIDIARALIHEPELLILDEPTTGLDPQTRRMLWDVLKKLQRDKKVTIFLTTHYMEEAADADYVVILDKGQIAAEGTPHELKGDYTNDYILLYGVEEQDVASWGYPVEKIRDGVRISVPDTATATELIMQNSKLFVDYEIIHGKMDDVFLAVTGSAMKEDD